MSIVTPAIKFNRHWRGRNVGDINTQLAPAVMEVLVRRKIAEYVPPKQEKKRRD